MSKVSTHELSRVTKVSETLGTRPLQFRTIGKAGSDIDRQEVRDALSMKNLSVLDLAQMLGMPTEGSGLENISLLEFRNKLEAKSKTLDEKLQEAQVITERARESGLDEGYREGKEQGFQQGEQEVALHAMALEELSDRLKAELDYIRVDLTASISRLIGASVKKILGTLVDEKYLLNIAQKEIGELVDSKYQVIVHCSERTREVIESNIGRIVPRLVMNDNSEPVVFKDEPTMQFGGFVLTYPRGQVDCRIELKSREILGQLGAE